MWRSHPPHRTFSFVGAVRSGPSIRSYRCPVVTCDMCGRTAEEADVALHWTTAVERGQKRFFCELCSRKHLRAMESKLDSEWW